jgi:hypothetical protein
VKRACPLNIDACNGELHKKGDLSKTISFANKSKNDKRLNRFMTYGI